MRYRIKGTNDLSRSSSELSEKRPYGLGQATNYDGLQLFAGSILYMDNLNVYTRENGQWVWLNSLFGAGQTVVPYGEGYLHLPSPGAASVLGLGGLIAMRRRRSPCSMPTTP